MTHRNARYRPTCLGPLVLGLTCLRAEAVDVVAYTDRHHPLTQTQGARVVLLDEASWLQGELSRDLPPNLTTAEQRVRHRLEQTPALAPQLANAYQDLLQAWHLGLTHLPAVVVDHRYVVYGDTNVARAVARIERQQGRRP